ncbi:hypothetical protein O3G_MSEX010489 [Manduca sexta]|uniref:HTH CENPB-type domain-containing protein n=1 Tax=Manduca sexta TaxID=7130 RepID=A0A921ZGR9_MANSE|nr:hypothetical protein O3G_MSEX010489 [Manduca sexta]
MALRLKRNALSLNDKMKILKYFDKKSQNYKRSQIAAELDIPLSTLSTILKYRPEIEEKCRNACGRALKMKKNKTGKYAELENILVDWIYSLNNQNLPVNGPFIKKRALEIATELEISDFTASSGWLERFKKRHSIALRQTDEPESGEDDGIDVPHDTFQEIVKDYEARDIFNGDEFGLFFKLLPDEKFSTEDKKCEDGRLSDQRFTILACVNSDGSEKLPILVIGDSDISHKDMPCQYEVDPCSWITKERFVAWLKVLDDYFEIQGRLVVLFVDDSPVHPKEIILNNINLVMLPPDSEYEMPMNQGIIKSIRQNYRTKLIERHNKDIDDFGTKNPVSIREALQYISTSWESVKPSLIQSCFKKSGFGDYYDIDDDDDEYKAEILMKYHDYLYVDYDLATCDSKKSDVASISSNNEISGIGNKNGQGQVSTQATATALTAIATLKQYLSTINSREGLEKLSFIENIVLTTE